MALGGVMTVIAAVVVLLTARPTYRWSILNPWVVAPSRTSATRRTCFALTNPPRSSLVQNACHREHQLGMGVVSDSQRFALQAQPRTAGEIELDGDSLVAHDPVQSTELIVHSGQRCGQVAVVGIAFGDRYGSRGGGWSGLQQSCRCGAGKPFASCLVQREHG